MSTPVSPEEDRRRPFPASVILKNELLAHWYPIIRAKGLLLYLFYLLMGADRQDGCYPGVDLIRRFLGVSSATISAYNRLLEMCGLIRIRHGELRGRRRASNRYYIDVVQPPRVSKQRLEKIVAEAGGTLPTWLARPVVKNCNRWMPLQKLLEERRSKRGLL